jgi:hypothetical protein
LSYIVIYITHYQAYNIQYERLDLKEMETVRPAH